MRVPELILELLSGKVDAIIIENPVAEQYVKVNPELSIVNIDELNSDTSLGSAIGIKKGQEELLSKVNQTISRLIKQNKINEFFNIAIDLTEQINKK